MYIAIAEIIFFIIIMSAILFYIAVKIFYKKISNVIPVEYLTEYELSVIRATR